ncbi:MAG: alpha/beta fold hydrolase [Actinomycetota bacterium]|nr:alpha/beta fold hydrolase [Actinomycetota bacterium]
MTDATPLLPGFQERHHERRGARIRVFAAGEGPPLLLVHGFGGAAWNFDGLAPLLPGRRLLIPDLPGHGGSSPLPAPSLRG